MLRRSLVTILVAAPMLAAACGGYGSSPSPVPAPEDPPEGAIVINIVAVNGAMSFSPNPATIPAGTAVVWRNADTQTHRVVLDDGELDTGYLKPGQSSAPRTLTAGSYHCSIHRWMVGRVVTD